MAINQYTLATNTQLNTIRRMFIDAAILSRTNNRALNIATFLGRYLTQKATYCGAKAVIEMTGHKLASIQ